MRRAGSGLSGGPPRPPGSTSTMRSQRSRKHGKDGTRMSATSVAMPAAKANTETTRRKQRSVVSHNEPSAKLAFKGDGNHLSIYPIM